MTLRPQTTEEITWEGTIKSILALTATQVGLRLALAIGGVIAWVLLTGRWAGPLLLFSAFFVVTGLSLESFIPFELRVRTGKLKRERANKAVVCALLGIALVIMWLTDYWPPLWWDLGEGRLWVAWWDGSCSVPVIWLWLRLALIVVAPWAIIRPFQDTDWALAIERLWPKAREVQFGQADIESPAIRNPHYNKKLHRPAKLQPDLVVQQMQQSPNEPDESVVMQVDGV